MSIVAGSIMCLGGLLAIVAAIGLHRFSTPYAKFHAAGKASPVAFLVAAVGASISLGVAGAVEFAIAAMAMILTLPTGVHLIFRAVHRTTGPRLDLDELAEAQQRERSAPDDG